jgi:putative phosphoribosyl transferase
MHFRDREEAGHLLAERLAPWASTEPVVVGLPRGGVPVAAEVAERLDADLDVIVVRKLGVPTQPELAMGAIGEGDIRVLQPEILYAAGVTERELATVEAAERHEAGRQAELFRAGRDRVPLVGRTVIVVDDGIATGSTARAAMQVARAEGAARVVLAVPVAPADTVAALRATGEEVVCLLVPPDFRAVGQWYEQFGPTSDDEVRAALAHPGQRPRPQPQPPEPEP